MAQLNRVDTPQASPPPEAETSQDNLSGNLDLAVDRCFASLKHDFESPFSSPHADGTFEIHHPIRWKEPLGDKLCILDVNSDRMLDPRSAWAAEDFDGKDFRYQASGIFNHYGFAKIHGYRYEFWQGEFPSDRHATWLRLPAMLKIFEDNPDCRFILYLDTDAMLPHFTRLPAEWLLNYWNITDETTFAMAEEPLEWFTRWKGVSQEQFHELFQEPARSWRRGYDSQGRPALNTGVMIVQNLPTTREMLKKWIECPLPDELGGNELCRSLAKSWPAEQGAFNEVIRDLYPDTVRYIPCTEALGHPGSLVGAEGRLVRHYTSAKTQIKEDFEAILAHDVIESLQRSMRRHMARHYRTLGDDEARGIVSGK